MRGRAAGWSRERQQHPPIGSARWDAAAAQPLCVSPLEPSAPLHSLQWRAQSCGTLTASDFPAPAPALLGGRVLWLRSSHLTLHSRTIDRHLKWTIDQHEALHQIETIEGIPFSTNAVHLLGAPHHGCHSLQPDRLSHIVASCPHTNYPSWTCVIGRVV